MSELLSAAYPGGPVWPSDVVAEDPLSERHGVPPCCCRGDVAARGWLSADPEKASALDVTVWPPVPVHALEPCNTGVSALF